MRGFRRPSWRALLLTVAGASLFVVLGFWQLRRADEKEAIVRRYAASASAAPLPFSEVAGRSVVSGYPRVSVSGRYLADRLYLLDNPRHDGLGGVEVFAPFAPVGAHRVLLVDMGFLAGDGSHRTPALPALPSGVATLHGLYLPPPAPGFEMGGNALARQTRWPKKSIFLDSREVSRDLGQPLFPRMLALDPEAASPYQRVRVPDFGAMTPARHRAYAFQWFCFAVLAVVILLVLHRRRAAPPPFSDGR